MNTRIDNDPDSTTDFERTTLAAIFSERERAHDAIHQLHEDGFGNTWLGLIRGDDAAASSSYGGPSAATSMTAAEPTEPRVEAENWFARVFGEGDESLHDSLVRHGVPEADAIQAGRIGSLTPDSAILTVDGGNDPETATEIITANGGRLITRGFSADRDSMLGTTGAANTFASSPDIASPSTLAADNEMLNSVQPNRGFDADASARPADATERMQLREERLQIDKERRARGEATIGKEIVTEHHEIDVPLVREELFIERRPVSAAAASSGAPIGETEIVRIPLTEEQLVVSKSAVVTEEVVIGKRAVTQTGHVSETTRREELTVDDVDDVATMKRTGSSGTGRI